VPPKGASGSLRCHQSHRRNATSSTVVRRCGGHGPARRGAQCSRPADGPTPGKGHAHAANPVRREDGGCVTSGLSTAAPHAAHGWDGYVAAFAWSSNGCQWRWWWWWGWWGWHQATRLHTTVRDVHSKRNRATGPARWLDFSPRGECVGGRWWRQQRGRRYEERRTWVVPDAHASPRLAPGSPTGDVAGGPANPDVRPNTAARSPPDNDGRTPPARRRWCVSKR